MANWTQELLFHGILSGVTPKSVNSDNGDILWLVGWLHILIRNMNLVGSRIHIVIDVYIYIYCTAPKAIRVRIIVHSGDYSPQKKIPHSLLLDGITTSIFSSRHGSTVCASENLAITRLRYIRSNGLTLPLTMAPFETCVGCQTPHSKDKEGQVKTINSVMIFDKMYRNYMLSFGLLP